jgi:hypothetical protein
MRIKFESRGLYRTVWGVRLGLCGRDIRYTFTTHSGFFETTVQQALAHQPEAQDPILARSFAQSLESFGRRLHREIGGTEVSAEVYIHIPPTEQNPGWRSVGFAQPANQAMFCNTINLVVQNGENRSDPVNPQLTVTLTNDNSYHW